MIQASLFAALMVLIQVFHPSLSPLLRLDLSVLHGEIWRIFSAHLTHASWEHLLVNLASFGALLWLYPELLKRQQWLLALLWCAPWIALVELFKLSGEQWYVGYSGVFFGTLAYASVRYFVTTRVSRFVLLFLGFKLIWEQSVGPLSLLEQTDQFQIATSAHLCGVIAGLLLGGITLWRQRTGRP